jgi:general secretion pathway protein C
MKFASTPRWGASLAALVLWALVAASALYWIWRVRTSPVVSAPVAGSSVEQTIDSQAVARALGATGERTTAGEASGRFVLRGVVTQGPDAGAALIAVDGKPPKPVRVGAPLPDADGWTLHAVTPRGATLADGAREVTLDVPQPEPHPSAPADGRADARPDMHVPATPVPLPSAIKHGLGLGMPPPAQP